MSKNKRFQNQTKKRKEKVAMGKHRINAYLLLGILIVAGAVFAQGGSGSDWQYCNAFNIVSPAGTSPYGTQIPSWYTTDYSTVSSYTPVSTWRRGFYYVDPATGLEAPVRMSHDNVVLRLDLLSGTNNVFLRGVKITLRGNRDFDPNHDLAPIHPQDAADYFGVDLVEADTLTGVQFYIEKGAAAMSDVNILDRIDIRGIAEQLIIDTTVQPLDVYPPSDPAHTELVLNPAYSWTLVSTDAITGWKVWEATFWFQDGIDIPYEGTFNSALYGLPFYRIWITLQTGKCHDCCEDVAIGSIEGISNADSFYVEIAHRNDLRMFRVSLPFINEVDMTATLDDVRRANPIPSPPDRARWSRSELIKGWDEIRPYIAKLWPRNLISTNDWISDSVLCNEINDSIFTADRQQPISIIAWDQGTCIDSAFMEIRYINDIFYGASEGTNFPGRVDSIVWRSPLSYSPWDQNGGPDVGWEWRFKHGMRDVGAPGWTYTTGNAGSNWWTSFGTFPEAGALWAYGPCTGEGFISCGRDSFFVLVGGINPDYLPIWLDGAYIRVTFRVFSRTNNLRWDRAPYTMANLSPGIYKDTVWTFKVDLSGPNCEMTCPDNYNNDNNTREFSGTNNRRDIIEGVTTYWMWLADSLPTIRMRVYDNYRDVHDRTNHGVTTYGGGVGGAGINWRDFEFTFRVQHCDLSWDTFKVTQNDLMRGVWIDETNNGQEAVLYINFEDLVTYRSDLTIPGIIPFKSGDFIYVILTRLLDDPDYGQHTYIWGTTLRWYNIADVIDPIARDSWGVPGGADGNYGTRNTLDNHVPVMWEVVGLATEYASYSTDTLGILRIDLEGPTAPDTFYYPPDGWVTSDSFQIITCNIYDQINPECLFDNNFDLPSTSPYSLFNRVSGVYSGTADQEARICINLKVRGCDGSWHPYYHTPPDGTIPDGRNFCLGEPDAIGLDVSKKFNEWGVRITFDPYRRLPTQARWRPGDKVCVTVYAWDNAVVNCQSRNGVAGPRTGWDNDNDPWIDTVNLVCSAGTTARRLIYSVPSRNEGYDRLHPDELYFTIRHIARWNFFVDCHAPVFTSADMAQVCNDTMFIYFKDVSARVHGVYCDNWVAGIGWSHGDLVEGADIMLIFRDTMTTPGITYVDTVLFQNLKYGEIHQAYHSIPGREYQYYYAELKPDPTNPRGAILLLYGDGTDATCHFFAPYDRVDWRLWAGDSPDVPWYPATMRCVSGGCYRWWHTLDPYSLITNPFMAWRYGRHDYTNLNIDTLGITFWLDTTYNNYENPNWALIKTGSFNILPETWLNSVMWFNDGAYDAYWTASTYNYPPDLTGKYNILRSSWTGHYVDYALVHSTGSATAMSSVGSYDPYIRHYAKDLNFIVAEIYTCTDSIIWECLAGSTPDADTLRGRTPHIVVDLFNAAGTRVWTIDEWYDCHCTPCFVHYYPERTGCVDWGRLHLGPFDADSVWLSTIRRLDTLSREPLVIDTVRGFLHNDSLVVTLTFNVRTPNDYGDGNNYTKHVFRWAYKIDMQAPTARFVSMSASTGYDEVNCFMIHASNHEIRLRLEDIYDANVGCAPGTLVAPGWTTTWPIPALEQSSDWVKYFFGTYIDQAAGLAWNPGTGIPSFVWSNERFIVRNCALDNYIARRMNLGLPGIDIYHGLNRTGFPPTVVQTHVDVDTIFIADSAYAVATVQDKLGNTRVITSNKIAIDNGLPKVKGFALATANLVDGVLTLNNWDNTKFKLPWLVPDQDSLVGVYNFTPVCTVIVRIWFNDNMDMRLADHLSGHIVRFQPQGWTHWFPVLPLDTYTGAPGGLRFPLAHRYVDYRDVRVAYSRPSPEEGIAPETPGEATALDNGWNSDREWLGYLVLAGEGAMDGIGRLRVQGFDDNAGNYMIPVDFPIRIVTGRPWGIAVHWPDIERLDTGPRDPWSGAMDDQYVVTGWSSSGNDSSNCNFTMDARRRSVEGFWDDSKSETDSVRFLIWWSDEPLTPAGITIPGYTFRWVDDHISTSPNITRRGDTTWVTIPTTELDLLHNWYPTLGGPPSVYSNNQKYASIVMQVFSRFRPVNPFMADTMLNLRIDNARPNPNLSLISGGMMIHGRHTVLPFGSTNLKICWSGGDVKQWDKMSIWLYSLTDRTEYPLYPAGASSTSGLFAPILASAPLYYSPTFDAVCLEYFSATGLPPGMWTVSWKAFDAIHVVDQATNSTITSYWTYYHTDCELNSDDADTLSILRPPFLARGDNLEDAIKSVYQNWPYVAKSDDIFPWWNATMENNWPDWPTWGWIDTTAIRAAGLPDLFRIDESHRVPQVTPIVQITTYNNPDYSSGAPDPLMHPYTESGGYMGDSLYVLLEMLPGEDALVPWVDLNIQDYWGGNISGSNLEINIRLYTPADVRTIGDRSFWVYKWTVDDQDNRFDGLVTIKATEHRRVVGTSTYHDWDHIAYIFLDTYDPIYEVKMLRSDLTVPFRGVNRIDYPAEEYIWFVNEDVFDITIDWDHTMFDPARPGHPVSYFNYGNLIYSRMWDHYRISIDGKPHYFSYDDPNDHLEARLWDDQLDPWDIHHPFWRQPDYMNPGITPSSYDDALPGYSFASKIAFFGDQKYVYTWDVAGEPEGLPGQGIAYILAKARDAAGNVLDYDEARRSPSKGKLVLIDIEDPTIDSAGIVATGETFTAYAGAFDDNFLGSNFTDMDGNGYVYVIVRDASGVMLGDTFWVDATGAIATMPWLGASPTPGDVVTVWAYDLAGNYTSAIITVVPELHCCEWTLCRDWNLIAFSVIPDVPTTIADVFGTMPVYGMSGSSYYPLSGSTLITPGMAVAVYPSAVTTISICGAPVTSFTQSLQPGWNLIGATWASVDFTAPVTTPAGRVDPGETRYYVCGDDYYRTTTLVHCRGHLVMATSACVLSVPGTRGKVVYTVKDNTFEPVFTGSLTADRTVLTFGAAHGATGNFDLGIDHYAIPARPGEESIVLAGGLDKDFRPVENEISWTFTATTAYNGTFEFDNPSWVVTFDGYPITSGQLVSISAGEHKIVVNSVAVPEKFALGQNLPNPFNAVTTISYDLPEKCNVTIGVYSVLGQRVATIVNGEQEAGYRTVVWNGNDDQGNPVPSGIYFYRMEAQSFKATRKMTLMK